MGTAPTETKMPRISAVIPTYNRGHLISRAINSVIAQTCPPNEIIVVDDGSKDNTRAAIAEFGDRVRYIYQDNAGSAVARHTGFVAAQSEWVALLDSDDIWNSDHLERISEAIIATGGRANYYFADLQRDKRANYKTQWQTTGFSIHEPYEMFEQGSNFLLNGIRPTMLQATVFKRSAYLAVGGFMEKLRFHDDSHMFIKLGLRDPICAVSGGGAIMMDDDQAKNRLSHNYNATKQGHLMKVSMFNDLLDFFDEQLTPEERSIISYRLSNSYLVIAKASWRGRDYFESIRNFALSIVENPRPLLGSIGRKVQI